MKAGQPKNGWSRDDKDRESEDTSCYNGCDYLLISARESVEKMCMIKRYLGNEQSHISILLLGEMDYEAYLLNILPVVNN